MPWNESQMIGPLRIPRERDEQGDVVAWHPDYHLNIAPELMAPDLQPFRVQPKTPENVWAGDDAPWTKTVFLRFPDERTARSTSLAKQWRDDLSSLQAELSDELDAFEKVLGSAKTVTSPAVHNQAPLELKDLEELRQAVEELREQSRAGAVNRPVLEQERSTLRRFQDKLVPWIGGRATVAVDTGIKAAVVQVALGPHLGRILDIIERMLNLI